MRARRCERERAFRRFLSADIREVDGGTKWWWTFGGRALAGDVVEPVEEADRLVQRVDAVHLDPLDDGRLRRVHRRDDDAAQLRALGERREACRAADRPHEAVEREFTGHREVREPFVRVLADDSLQS